MAKVFLSDFLTVSLDTVARILQINPAHFNQSYATDNDRVAFGFCNTCTDLWCQYADQADNGLARESLAEQIVIVSEMLDGILGRPVYPKIRKKYFPYSVGSASSGRGNPVHIVPCSCSDTRLFSRRFYIGDHILGFKHEKWTALQDEQVVYSDLNSDTLIDTATISFLAPSAIDTNRIGIFYQSSAGDRKNLIRDSKSIYSEYISTTEQRVTITFNAYQMIKPSLWEERGYTDDYSGDCNCKAINFHDTTNLVETVSIAHVEWDNSIPLVEFIMRSDCGDCGGVGCDRCETTREYGCYIDYGKSVLPFAASWNGTKWVEKSINYNNVIGVAITYWDQYDNNFITDPQAIYDVDQRIQRAIALASMGRMNYQCECECNKRSPWIKLWTEMDLVPPGGRIVDYNKISNPFGTSKGGFMAYDIFKSIEGGVIVQSGVES